MCFILKKNKQKALELVKQKINGEIKITYKEIFTKTGYEKRQLIRFSQEIEKKDIDVLLVHGLAGRSSNNSAPNQEIEYIKNFKNQYPVISISQFMDIYHEDVIWNKEKIEDVKKYNLKVRSKSFFQQLYKKEGWKSPIKHKCFDNKKDNHPLRDPMPRRGMLIMTDGTPQVIYADRTSILWNQKDGELTQVGRMLEELGIELIYANSSEAKGKIEKMNFTIQNRLLNDIKRFNIKTYEELNKWFNDFYIDYINKKFSYKPREEETEFIPLGNTDLTKIMCIKEERIILNGNMISYKNNYYIPITNDGNDFIFYKGTKVEVWQDIFNTTLIRICKDKKVYNTRKIEGHRQDPIKREQKIIQDQKELEKLFRERDERLKARAKRS